MPIQGRISPEESLGNVITQFSVIMNDGIEPCFPYIIRIGSFIPFRVIRRNVIVWILGPYKHGSKKEKDINNFFHNRHFLNEIVKYAKFMKVLDDWRKKISPHFINKAPNRFGFP